MIGRPMYEERSWGSYKVLDLHCCEDGMNSLTKLLVIKKGSSLSYQRHMRRREVWTIVRGTGMFVLNGVARVVSRGDSMCILQNDLHTIKALDELHIIEVQIGDELVEEDIERLDFDWGPIEADCLGRDG